MKKIKCDRCKALTSLGTRIDNTEKAIDLCEARGYDTSGFLYAGLDSLLTEQENLTSEACTCVWVEQGELPFSNTGVKISAFRASDSTKAQK